MKLQTVLTITAISFLTACSSSPSPYPVQGIASPAQEAGYPQQGIGKPQQAIKLDDEMSSEP